MLYWAEGAKQKTNGVSQCVCFSNSDSLMIKVFLKWLRICLKIPNKDISFDIYIHENHKDQNTQVKKYWSNVLDFLIVNLIKSIIRNTNLKLIGII